MTAPDSDEVCDERDQLLDQNEKLKANKERLIKTLKDGDVLIRDLNIPAVEWGYARSMFRELAAWIEEGNI